MSMTKTVAFGDGREWAVGSMVDNYADIIIPATAIDNLTDQEIGRRVRLLIPVAIDLLAQELESNIEGWIKGASDESLSNVYGILRPYKEHTRRIARMSDVLEAELAKRDRQTRGRKTAEPKSGFVYLAHCETGHYKIGYSVSPESRIQQLNAQMPVPITLIHVIETDDMVTAEQTLHDRFDGQRVSGEWFTLSGADIDYIKDIDVLEHH